MADISAAQVKELRDMTGSGIMDCKRALQESDGDIEKAVAWLREKGIAKAEKKSARVAAEGAVIAKIADDKKSGVLVEISLTTIKIKTRRFFCVLLMQESIDKKILFGPAKKNRIRIKFCIVPTFF